MNPKPALKEVKGFAKATKAAESEKPVERLARIRRFACAWETDRLGELADALAVYALRKHIPFDGQRGAVGILVRIAMPSSSRQRIHEMADAYIRLKRFDSSDYGEITKLCGGFDKLARMGSKEFEAVLQGAGHSHPKVRRVRRNTL